MAKPARSMRKLLLPSLALPLSIRLLCCGSADTPSYTNALPEAARNPDEGSSPGHRPLPPQAWRRPHPWQHPRERRTRPDNAGRSPLKPADGVFSNFSNFLHASRKRTSRASLTLVNSTMHTTVAFHIIMLQQLLVGWAALAAAKCCRIGCNKLGACCLGWRSTLRTAHRSHAGTHRAAKNELARRFVLCIRKAFRPRDEHNNTPNIRGS